MIEKQELIEALQRGSDNLLLSDVNSHFTIGDLKEIITNAMIKQFQILENIDDDDNYRLEDWQVNDVKLHYFKEWLQKYN